MNEIKQYQPNTIIFNATHPNGTGEVLRLEKGKFFYMGQEVEDVNKIYERFSEWMKLVEKK